VRPETTTAAGRRGEDLACRHLESQGLRLLERNCRCRAGEIDLVMLDGGTLVMIEVRSR
jgi:putative endonuclease